MTVDELKDLKIVVGEERRVNGSRMRNAVPPPTNDEKDESEIGRGVLKKVKPRGIASELSVKVELGEALTILSHHTAFREVAILPVSLPSFNVQSNQPTGKLYCAYLTEAKAASKIPSNCREANEDGQVEPHLGTDAAKLD
jgi:hypothetical protein